MGLGHSVEMASEMDSNVLGIFKDNFEPVLSLQGDIRDYFDGEVAIHTLTETERLLIADNPGVNEPELLVGGPPCQGHSDLNNHSRRNDPRNSLYFSMVRAARVLRPRAIIIENVQTVIRSKEEVVQQSIELLKEMGYEVAERILKAEEYGVPQLRRRHFLVASTGSKPDFSLLDGYKVSKVRDLRWALKGLGSSYDEDDLFNSSANSSEENRKRMRWLIDNDEFDLPDRLRPPCHQNGHNYPAVYGRMRWGVPAHTITAGFGSNGQGRFMHPDEPRTLTPHEAARVQTFPDWFDFSGHAGRRRTLSRSIGNAVPPLLAMYVSFVALRSLE
jgi:DNA (cytosine-5)-methyltransferase 1